MNENRQTKILNSLKNVKVECLDRIQLEKVLFNISQFAIESSFTEAIKDCVKHIISDSFKIEFSDQDSSLLLVSYNFGRKDHQRSWLDIKKLFDEYEEITIEELKFSKYNLLSLSTGLKSIICFFKVLPYMMKICNYKESIYLTGRIVELARLYNKLKKFKVHSTVSLMFFDGGSYENLITQYLKCIGIKTVTMQHGQPVFHGLNTDRINQTMILNFTSDYIIVTSEYSKKQFMYGGVKEEAIAVLGSWRKIEDYKESSNKLFTVFLDCPTFEGAIECNKRIIKLSEILSYQLEMNYVIKLHPQDSPDHYADVQLKKGIFLEKGRLIHDALIETEFAILHMSGVYLDIMSKGVKSFCLITGMYFPLVMNDLDKFSSLDELEAKIQIWRQKDFNSKRDYIKELTNYYLSPVDSKKRHKTFICNLINNSK